MHRTLMKLLEIKNKKEKRMLPSLSFIHSSREENQSNDEVSKVASEIQSIAMEKTKQRRTKVSVGWQRLQF